MFSVESAKVASMVEKALFVRVAVPSPLRRLFDYRVPPNFPALVPGMRVRLPFGRGDVVGVVVALSDHTEVAPGKLRSVSACLDSAPVLTPELMELLTWSARYYHHPPGEVFAAALPVLLRQGRAAELPQISTWRLTLTGMDADESELVRAPRQRDLMQLLRKYDALSREQLDEHLGQWREPMARLMARGWVEVQHQDQTTVCAEPSSPGGLDLNPHQQAAVGAVADSWGHFQTFLLEGVTGSGKTEVYLSLVERVLARGEQVLVLVPEIGLTPQLVQRFRDRLSVPVAVLHSGLNDQERLNHWLQAGRGEVGVVIGTRSAVFTPLLRPGFIILDEEHDPSFKQQEGFRYSARDVAVRRAQLLSIPVLMGSATPSLESLYNVQQGRYQVLHLPERAGGAQRPYIQVLDVRNQPMDESLSRPLIKTIDGHLQQDGQVLLFLNRRGFAPTWLCHGCGWVAQCPRCDAHLVLHEKRQRLRCHHCDTDIPLIRHCPQCQGEEFRPIGHGTERVEQAVQNRFPHVASDRIDRDTTRRKQALQQRLDQVHSGQTRILIGTQMLAKGHHFPDVTLVALLNVDHGFYSSDFRAAERMAQLVVQVAGRAGRGDRPGRVLVQTHHPDHPLLQLLITQGYGAFARQALLERQAAQLPPYSYLALIRAEATDRDQPMTFLKEAAELSSRFNGGRVMVMGPVTASMEKRAGRYRAQLLLQADDRPSLHKLLAPWIIALEGLKSARRVRWSIDVDPVEVF